MTFSCSDAPRVEILYGPHSKFNMDAALVVVLVLFHQEDLDLQTFWLRKHVFAITGAAVYFFNIETEANVHLCDS